MAAVILGVLVMLAVLFLTFSFVLAISQLGRPAVVIGRPEGVRDFKMLRSAEAPAWVSVVLPFIGAAVVLAGAVLIRGQARASAKG